MGEGLKHYADSLAKIIGNNHSYLTKALGDLQEKCRMVAFERNIPRDIVVDIRKAYEEIRNKLKETKAIQQVLQGKYRHYYRRDSVRDKQVTEFGFIAKNCYSKFEYTLMQVEAKNNISKKGTILSKETAEPNQSIISIQGESGCEVHLKPDVEEAEPTEVVTPCSQGRVINGPIQDLFPYKDRSDIFTPENASKKAMELLTEELTLFL